jgi:transcriptional regulator with XRE-family HTH domain
MSKLGIILGAGERIRQIREKLGWNQDKFARYLGVRTSTISRYECGRIPNEPTLAKIAKIGNTTPEWILKGESESSIMLRLNKAPQLKINDHAPQLDRQLLMDIIALMEECLEDRKVGLSPAQKGHLVLLLYDRYVETAIPVTKNTVLSYVEAFSC